MHEPCIANSTQHPSSIWVKQLDTLDGKMWIRRGGPKYFGWKERCRTVQTHGKRLWKSRDSYLLRWYFPIRLKNVQHVDFPEKH